VSGIPILDAVAVSVSDSAAGEFRGRRARPVARNQPMLAPADSRADFWGVVYIYARDGSRVGRELALRPGFSARARMPLAALSAPRGERLGLLVFDCRVLTAGPVLCFYGR
jgi:hypothetical protein